MRDKEWTALDSGAAGEAAFDEELVIAGSKDRLAANPSLTGTLAFEGLGKLGGDDGIAAFIQQEALRGYGKKAFAVGNRETDNMINRSAVGRGIVKDVAAGAVQDEEERISDTNERLRYRWEDGIKAWREYVKEMRTCRVASVSEVIEMEKLLDRLLNKADKVSALVTSLNKLAEALSDPRLKEVLK